MMMEVPKTGVQKLEVKILHLFLIPELSNRVLVLILVLIPQRKENFMELLLIRNKYLDIIIAPQQEILQGFSIQDQKDYQMIYLTTLQIIFMEPIKLLEHLMYHGYFQLHYIGVHQVDKLELQQLHLRAFTKVVVFMELKLYLLV